MKNLFVFLLLSLSFVVFSQKNPRDLDLKWKTDTNKTSVPLKEFTALMYPDGIPPIDNPLFYNYGQAEDDYFEFEPVIAVSINGETKAYPLSILMYHEIVNDTVGGTAVCVTYCPLCNSAVVFNRHLTFNGKEYNLDFGVSGMLRRSDMVMYDRQTETWWQQFTGEALVGELTGAQLEFIPAPIISFEEYYELYPEGLYLEPVYDIEGDEKFEYGYNPYIGYDDLANEKPRLFFEDIDSRLPAMTRVIDVTVNKKHKIYRHNYVRKKGVVNDTFQLTPIAIFFTTKTVSVLDSADIRESKVIGAANVFIAEVNGYKLTFKKKKDYFIDKETKSKWDMSGACFEGEFEGQKMTILPHGSHFAFAMFTFHPDCEVFIE